LLNRVQLALLTWNADPIVALEVAFGTIALLAVELVRSIPALGLAVANPPLWDATVPIGALEPVWAATGPLVAGFLI